MCDPTAVMGCSRSSGEYYTPSPVPYLSLPAPPMSPPTPVPTPILTVAAIRERKIVATEEAVLFVENLPSDVNGEELRKYFEEKGAGGIVRCDLPMGSSGKAKGYGTVVFGSASEAERAVIGVDGTVLRERRVRVRVNRFVGGGE
jgi:RNA recognition motif-containing protein